MAPASVLLALRLGQTQGTMDVAGFWAFIEAARMRTRRSADVATTGSAAAWLTRRLARLPPSAIIAFDRIFERQFDRARKGSLRDAAAIVRGFYSPDGFDYFRGWLIAQGRNVFERALRDPDSLTNIIASDAECEEFLYVAQTAYEKATRGGEIPSSKKKPLEFEALKRFFGDGVSWDNAATRLPGLWARFGRQAESVVQARTTRAHSA